MRSADLFTFWDFDSRDYTHGLYMLNSNSTTVEYGPENQSRNNLTFKVRVNYLELFVVPNLDIHIRMEIPN